MVAYLVKYGLDMYPKMADPGADAMKQMFVLNAYFHEFLVAKAKEADGWLGPKGTHAKQGGKISAAIRALKTHGWTEQNVVTALRESFEPGPSVQGAALFFAAQSRGRLLRRQPTAAGGRGPGGDDQPGPAR